MFMRVLARATVVMAVSTWLAATPQVAHAIPSSGSYVIDAAQSNGLTGSFTVNLAGDGIETYNLTYAGSTWATGDTIHQNTGSVFEVEDIQGSDINTRFLLLDWRGGPTLTKFHINSELTPGSGLNFSYQSQSVPEPSSAALLVAGLGLLVGYHLRQRRPAGLQIG